MVYSINISIIFVRYHIQYHFSKVYSVSFGTAAFSVLMRVNHQYQYHLGKYHSQYRLINYFQYYFGQVLHSLTLGESVVLGIILQKYTQCHHFPEIFISLTIIYFVHEFVYSTMIND